MEATIQLEKKQENEKEKKKQQHKKLVERLKQIFRNHIGIEQGISHIGLLREVYGENVEGFTKYQKYYILR